MSTFSKLIIYYNFEHIDVCLIKKIGGIDMSKRVAGEGTIYLDKSTNRYVGQFPYKDLETGKTKRKKFTGLTKKEVLEKGQNFKLDLEHGCVLPKNEDDDITLGEYMNKWLEDTVRSTVRIKTYERYECAYRCHIKPYLASTKLSAFTRVGLQEYFVKLSKSGKVDGSKLAPRTVNAIRRLLKMVFKYAVGDGLLMKNPVELTKPIRIEPTPINFFKAAEYQKLLEVAKAESCRDYLVVRIAFATGMRIGEIFGLEYSAIDFEKNLISVKQTIVTSRHGKRVQRTAKNSTSLRTILVERKLIEELHKAYQLHNLKKKTVHGWLEQKHDFIIENADGSFCDPAYFSDKIFKKKLLRKAGLSSKFRFHDCRHTHATWLLEKNVDIKTISERLGHKSIRITLDTYAHVVPKLQQEAVDALDDILHSAA